LLGALYVCERCDAGDPLDRARANFGRPTQRASAAGTNRPLACLSHGTVALEFPVMRRSNWTLSLVPRDGGYVDICGNQRSLLREEICGCSTRFIIVFLVLGQVVALR
jgi:hypothetical protein